MKRLFTYSTWCMALLFTLWTFQSNAQNDCGTAVVIGSIPFSSGPQTTCGTVNDYAAGFSTCVSSNYGAGEDYVYSITITTAPVTYQLALGGADVYKIASVHSACPPAGANCVGGIATSSGTTASGSVTFPTNGTYYIIIDTWPSPNCGAFTLDITIPPPPPANDECATAIPLTVGATCVFSPYTTTGATGSAGAPAPGCGSYAGGDVWFSVVVPAGGQLIFDTNTGTITDSGMAIYSGSCGALTLIECDDDDSPNGAMSLINRSGLTPGSTVFIRFWEYNNDSPGTFSICVNTPPPPPSNDNCAGATALTVNADLNCGVSTAGTTSSATQSTETAPTCSATGVNDDVWYTFVATNAAHQVRISGATNTTAAAVYTGSCGTLTQIVGSCLSTTSGLVNINLTGLSIGTTYRVRVYTTVSTVGTAADFVICIGTPPPPPANDDCAGAVALTVNADLNCAVSTAGTTQSATASTETAPTCSATGVNDDVWYTFVATNAAHQVRISGATNTTAAAVYTGSCGTLTQIVGSCLSTSSGLVNINLTGLSIGTTYRVRVYTTVSTVGTVADFIICVGTPPPPPANDNCAGATAFPTIPLDGSCVTLSNQSTISATASGVTPSGACTSTSGTADDDIWFSFVAPASTVILTGTFVSGVTDVYWHVFSGSCGSSMVAVLCTDTNTGGTITGLTAGNTYYIRLYTWSSGVNTVQNICLSTPPPPPPNDACAQAITISGCQSISGTTSGATGDGLTTTCGTSVSSTSQGVWYRFVGDGNPAEVNTCGGAAFDTKIQVLTGSCGTFTCVAGNDDNCSLQSRVNWLSTLGETYYIYVYPLTNPGGNFTLNLISGPPCPAPTPVSSNVSTTSATVSWTATSGAVTYSYSFGTAGHVCGTGAVAQAGTSVNLTNLIPNTNYTFCVRTNCSCGSSTYSTVNFMTAPLPNDACAGAIPVTCNSTVTGSTVGAVSDIGQGSCGSAGTPGNGVWYSLAGDGSQITLDLCGSAYDTKVHVYSGSCAGLSCVISNDDNASICTSATTRSQVVFNTTPGTTYYILVSGFGTTTGAFSMNVGCVCGAPLSFPWSNNAIGANTTGEGIDNVCGGSIDISSNGYSPSLTSDALFLSSQLLCGNQSITVKVQSITNGGFAGIMFRDTVSTGSRFIAIKTQLNPHVFRELRAVANGNRLFQQIPAPGHTWLRLTRSGNTFTGFTSHNGINWNQAFTVNLALNSCVRVGLFAQGLNPASVAQAQFSMITGFQSQVISLPNMTNSINEGIQGLTVFPNPASSELNLKIGTEFLGKNISINVMDQMGRVVLQRNIPELQTQQEQINVSNLPGGLYVISLMTEGQAAQIQKFIVSGNRP